jgi:hypothetical protein
MVKPLMKKISFKNYFKKVFLGIPEKPKTIIMKKKSSSKLDLIEEDLDSS